jgi:hypothetical protein
MTKVSVCEIKFLELDGQGKLIKASGVCKRVQDCDWPVEENYD